MTTPVAPWPEYARSEWARIGARWAEDEAVPEPDPLRPPETDEEAWDLLEGAVVASAWWAIAVAVVGGALAAVLAVLGLRKAARRA